MKQVWLKILIALLLSGLVFVIFISSQKAQPIIPRDNINSLANDAMQYLTSNDISSLRSITTKEGQWIWDNFSSNLYLKDVNNLRKLCHKDLGESGYILMLDKSN